MKAHKLTPRETAQVIAALRLYGRAQENDCIPAESVFTVNRFRGTTAMTLDEIETLIGRLDGTWTEKGLRTWDAWRYR